MDHHEKLMNLKSGMDVKFRNLTGKITGVSEKLDIVQVCFNQDVPPEVLGYFQSSIRTYNFGLGARHHYMELEIL